MPPEPAPAPILAPDDVEACLRVLEHAVGSDPTDPAWAAVHAAAAAVYKGGKKQRKRERHAARTAHDRTLLADTARFREQNPTSDPVTTPPTPVDQPARMLVRARYCYVCRDAYREIHDEYHMLCPPCAAENVARRHARCDLRGRRAVVTGGRIKIGFQVALKLLRDGADVLVTTRFPRDAARRFAAVPDAEEWLPRLRIHGADFLDLAGLAKLLDELAGEPHLDILINNASQTIRRPGAYHRQVVDAEGEALRGLAGRVEVRDAPTAGVRALDGAGSALALDSAAGQAVAAARLAELFPAGRTDETGEPLDLRDRNSWTLRAHEVHPADWLEVQLVNAFAPFLLTTRLRDRMLASPWPDRYVVQVSAMEGSFSRVNKTVRHPHTNMAKASLNMLVRTTAADYAAAGIYMNSVDTGWVTDERPHPAKQAQRAEGFRPPLDVIDGAARVYDPVVRGVGGDRVYGRFLKDYRAVEW